MDHVTTFGIRLSGIAASHARRVIGYGAAAGALGATSCCRRMARPPSVGQALQDRHAAALSGAGAAGRQNALVGLPGWGGPHQQNKGIQWPPVEIVVADDESKPTVGRPRPKRATRKTRLDAHFGGFLPTSVSPVCRCRRAEGRHMISVCLDTTLTTTVQSLQLRVHDYAPAQAVAFAAELIKHGKKCTSLR